MTTANQMSASLAPGSIEYGKRQEMESMLGGIMAGRQGQAPAVGGLAPPAGAASSGDGLMDMLTSGEVAPYPDQPLTDGLSVGPGAGPPSELGPGAVPSQMEDRLRLVAMNAKTPHLRAMARMALRREVRRRMLSSD